MLNAVESENWEEVTKYSTTILEEDPSDFEAWFYKGSAAGWNSRHIDDPSKEIINCFRNAFANSKEEDTEELLNLFGTKGTELLVALASSSRAFAQEHAWKGAHYGGWDVEILSGHILKILGFIDASYSLTEINRNDRVEKLNSTIDYAFLGIYGTLHNKIHFEGTHHSMSHNPFSSGFASDFGLKSFYEPNSEAGLKWKNRVDEILETYSNDGYDLKDLDEEDRKFLFKDPRIGNESKGGGCFVATAVYGEENHFNLIVLRSFRDNFLKNYYFGSRFIAFYYKHGPKLAKKVVDSKLLKSLFTPLVELGVFIVKLFRLG